MSYHRLPLIGDEEDTLQSLRLGEIARRPLEPNLDTFLRHVYQYHFERGWRPMILRRIGHMITTGFVIGFSTVLLVFVDWERLELVSSKSFTFQPFHYLVLLFEAVFAMYWLVSLVRLFLSARDIFKTRRFFHEDLAIPESDLLYMTWDELCGILVASQQIRPLSLVKRLDALDIAHRILRMDNFLVALFGSSLWKTKIGVARMNKILEWNVRIAVSGMVDPSASFSISKNYGQTLRMRFLWLSLLNILAMPFMLVFMCMYFLLRNAEEYKSQPTTLGLRTFSESAKWLFREYNEYPHVLAVRLRQAEGPSYRYLSYFATPCIAAVAKTALFIAGSLSAAIIAISLVREELFLGWMILGKPLAWYLAVFGVVVAVCRSLTGTSAASPACCDTAPVHPEWSLHAFSESSHYHPSEWMGRAHMKVVQDAMLSLFPYRVAVFLHEVAAVVTTPFLLLFWLRDSSHEIMRFFEQNTVHLEGVGDVCTHANFDQDFVGPQGVDRGSRSVKIYASLLSFVAHHPTSWDIRSRPAAAELFEKVVYGGEGAGGRSMLQNSLLIRPRRSEAEMGLRAAAAGAGSGRVRFFGNESVHVHLSQPQQLSGLEDDGHVRTADEVSRQYFTLLQSFHEEAMTSTS